MAQFLRSHGYLAYALEGGLQAWYDAGLPLEPKSAERRGAPDGTCPDCGQPLASHAAGRGG